jgi:hypothetical protein
MTEFYLNDIGHWSFSIYERPHHNSNIRMGIVKFVTDYARTQCHCWIGATAFKEERGVRVRKNQNPYTRMRAHDGRLWTLSRESSYARPKGTFPSYGQDVGGTSGSEAKVKLMMAASVGGLFHFKPSAECR